MFYSYLLTALRSMVKNPLYSAINIFGLSVGLACCIVFLAFLTYQFSFDTQFDGYQRIYQVTQTRTFEGGREFTQPRISKADHDTLIANLPDIEQHTAMRRGQIRVDMPDARVETIAYADDSFFAIFNLPMVDKNPGPLLAQPNQAVISESFAKKYFGNQSPVGKTLTLENGALVITGLMKDVPANTHLASPGLQILVAISGAPSRPAAQTSYMSYLKFEKGTQIEELNHQIAYLTGKEKSQGDSGTADSTTGASWNNNVKTGLQPIYLSHLASGALGTGGSSDLFQNWYFIYAFGGLAAGVLLISCFNFINLTTARFTQRNREIGLRKVMGASKGHILGQFFCEALLSTLLAIVVGFVIANMALPWFGQLIEIDLATVDYGTAFFYLCLAGLIIATTLFAGFYPGMVLSRVKPIAALSANTPAASKSQLRKILTVVQFSLSILLMTVCFTLYQQLNHLKNLDLGINLENVALVGMGRGMGISLQKPGQQDTMEEQLLAHPAIESVSLAPFSFGEIENEYLLTQANANPISLTMMVTDKYFFDHYQTKLAAGVTFDPNKPSHKITIGSSTSTPGTTVAGGGRQPSSSGAVILSQTGMDKLGISNPQAAIGNKLTLKDNSAIVLTVIGATKAFPKIMEDEDKTVPFGADLLVLGDEKSLSGVLTARIQGSMMEEGKNHISQVTKRINGRRTGITFIEQELAGLFEVLARAMASVGIFAVLAIIVAIMGLYAMSTFTVERRTREIGIHKVMGCSRTRLTGLLAWDFCKPVFIALAIAIPLAYIAANQVIQHFAARIPLEWITFGLVPLITIAIALLTVSGHTIKAAQTNPVIALRYE
ncbi:ABC transporter permease [Porticoccus sp. W117]|uniref:ABC transporter permease n=1 Tax=Porticoccus sp. W117 TaxID=3054777 RepID=UPI00259515FF|nr:FtsX-like permease family protein [Porticoccus sp. W117]MDM3872515.1 ABC transporter permease [Porticoccus sp. W117]